MFAVNGVNWDIKFIDAHSPMLMRSDGTITVGVTDWDDKTIYLSSELHGYKLKKVLCHELCHVVIMSVGIYMNIYQEEVLADFVSTYATRILNLTKELLERIQ